MPHKIKTFRSLLQLVALDESDHPMKEFATLLVSALRDWGNCQDIVSCIAGFKAYFGDPLTVENTAHYNGQDTEDWTWRAEAGTALSNMIQRSEELYQIADFDTITERLLSYYEQKFLLTSKEKPLKYTGFAAFNIYSENLTRADIVHWLGAEPDEPNDSDVNHRIFKTPFTRNIHSGSLIQQMVKRLTPLKARLLELKKANPEVDYELQVVIWSSEEYIVLNSDIMLFLGEIGVRLEQEIFAINR